MKSEVLQKQKRAMTGLHNRYAKSEFLASDPIEIPARYHDKSDIEIAAYLSAMFAYGNVRAIRGFLFSLLDELGASPHRQLIQGKIHTSLYYRFQNAKDVTILLNGVGEMLRQKGSLEGFFGEPGMPLRDRIAAFQISLLKFLDAPVSRGLKHLIGDPAASSAQKRYCMFLRWMVRTEFPDFGIYKSFLRTELIVPLDLHVARMARNLGWTRKEAPSWGNAQMITAALRDIHPDDPLRVDFPLTRPGILGHCKSRFLPTCEACEVRTCCRIYARHS